MPEPEGDELAEAEDNSLGRLLALSDGIFAIAVTLLALDLEVPELDGHVTDSPPRARRRLARDRTTTRGAVGDIARERWRAGSVRRRLESAPARCERRRAKLRRITPMI